MIYLLTKSDTKLFISAVKRGAIESPSYSLDVYHPEILIPDWNRFIQNPNNLGIRYKDYGLLLATYGRRTFTKMMYAQVIFFYIFPEYRNSFAAYRLLEHYVAWAESNRSIPTILSSTGIEEQTLLKLGKHFNCKVLIDGWR